MNTYLYAHSLIQTTLMNSKDIIFKEIPIPTIQDILSMQYVFFLSNNKFGTYVFHLDAINSNTIEAEEDLFQYGQYFNHTIHGVIASKPTENSHLLDLLNYSFTSLSKDPAMSLIALQGVFLLKRIYSQDSIPITKAEPIGEGVPYEL